MAIRSKNTKQDFIQYLEAHPDQRFWQAVRNWSGYAFVIGSDHDVSEHGTQDTFYLEGKNHMEREPHRKGNAKS